MARRLSRQSVDSGLKTATVEANIKLKVVATAASKTEKAITWVGKDRALFADPEKKELLSGATRSDLTESIGTALNGILFTTLSQQQLDELALLVSERGVVFLREQAFHPDDQVRVFKRLGKTYSGFKASEHALTPGNSNQDSRNVWHSDASFEANPPSYSFLNVQDTPEFGGDAAWVSQYGLYDELSAHMKGFLDGLDAVRSSHEQDGRVTSEHPAVRTHPVTGLKALNITPGSATGFAELKQKESDNLLDFLDQHIDSETQHIVHWDWEPGCVVIWDNRCTAYKATPSTYASGRPATRTAIVGEKPYFDPSSEGREERRLRIAQETKDERERLEAIKKRYNNTPLRRILSQQGLAMRPGYYSRTPEAVVTTANHEKEPPSVVDNKPPSRADSVLSAEVSEPPLATENHEQRTALWTKDVQVQLQGSKVASVPIKLSNTPMRRILERQVSSSLERRSR